MRTDEFVMRGQSESGVTETLNFSGFKPGYAYKLIEFMILPGVALGGAQPEVVGSITAGKTAVDPASQNFNEEGLIGSAVFSMSNVPTEGSGPIGYSIVNDTFLITQNLLLTVQDIGTSNMAVNWQCRFMPVKLSGSEEAVANYKQFTISDGS